MQFPSAALSTLRPDIAGSLETFDMSRRDGFIATEVLPAFEVATKNGTFGKFALEQMLKEVDVTRAPGAGYSRDTAKFTTDTYACQEYGAEEVVDNLQANMYRNFFDAEVVLGKRAMRKLLVAMEKRVAALIFNTTTWTGSSLTTAVSTQWATVATATPVADVSAAKKKVFASSGMWPNALIINANTLENLRNCVSIIDRLKYNGIVDVRPSAITAQAIAAALGVDRVIVAGQPRNTATEGQTAAMGMIWSDSYAMVARISESQDITEPCLGRIFNWTEDGGQIDGTIESYDEQRVRGRVIRARHDVHEKVLLSGCGHLLSNIG